MAEGTITGFLGPNGAGKATTLRMLLGLVTPTSATATIASRPYAELDAPFLHFGAVLEATSFHPGRRARDHPRVLAVAAGPPNDRVPAVLEQVGLGDAAHRRVKGFSLGMRQRLDLAAALLGDPQVLILDEPAGLDPEGVHWLRQFLRSYADRGGTVLVSSHLLAEVAQTVDDVVIIDGGRLVRQSSLRELANEATPGVWVRTPQAAALRDTLMAQGITTEITTWAPRTVAKGHTERRTASRLSRRHAAPIIRPVWGCPSPLPAPPTPGPPGVDQGMLGWSANIETLTIDNDRFRTVLFTGQSLQLTVMSLQPGEEIGAEVHPALDQFIRIEQGRAEVVMGRSENDQGETHHLAEDWSVIIPAGTWHNVINCGDSTLKLYSIYAPPEHPQGTVHRTKAEADAAEAEHD